VSALTNGGSLHLRNCSLQESPVDRAIKLEAKRFLGAETQAFDLDNSNTEKM
jgi:hypothetical protein